jgi:hypothetical protein
MHQRVWNNCLKVIKDNVPSISYTEHGLNQLFPLKLEQTEY